MLVLGLVDTALELVPANLTHHPVVIASAQQRGKAPHEILLDESKHAKVLATLPEAKRRGRPDIAHRSLLVALDSVLARDDQLKLFVHTYPGEIIMINPKTRLPRRIHRFVGLMEQLLLTKRVPLHGEPLLQVRPGPLETYLKELQPSHTTLLTTKGKAMTPTQLANSLQSEERPLVLIGGFAHGEPESKLSGMVDQQVSFDPEPLPTSTIVGMLIHSMEQVLDLTRRRFQASHSSE